MLLTPALDLLGGDVFNPLNAELNPICHLLALLGAHHIFHVSWLRVKSGSFSRCFLCYEIRDFENTLAGTGVR